MRIHRRAPRFAGLIVAAGVLVVGSLAAPSASAAPATDPAALATALESRLGDRTAGSYIDSGKLVVTIASQSDAKTVRAAGAVPKVVERSGAQLEPVRTAVRQTGITGLTWGVDPKTNQVRVQADSSVTAAELAKVKARTKSFGDAVRYERVAGKFRKFISGGDAIYTGGARCSLGFNVKDSGGADFFLTAGHCTNIGSTWYADSGSSQLIGSNHGTSFPGNDYGIVRYTGSVQPAGDVNLYNGSHQDITTAGDPVVGDPAMRSGSTTRVHQGSVTGVNQCVSYPQGTVCEMIRTNICAEPGDSGGSLFWETKALGLTSGGSGNCSSGGTTFYQTVTEPMRVYGVNVW